jgi:hypothetical protein
MGSIFHIYSQIPFLVNTFEKCHHFLIFTSISYYFRKATARKYVNEKFRYIIRKFKTQICVFQPFP